ncbi:helix-turn-helix domain-containing protein [Streptomyces sp. NPDC060243]|uniref:helix-turn-helix domain-containing protein n=1 Tax=Streptomyces sp. NPDC060243 TaxID=3347081 RepID=UPI003668DEEB
MNAVDVPLLRRARTAKGWTQEQVCARLNAITGGGTSPTLLSAWESGRKRTGLRNRAALSKLFEIPVVQLFAHQDRHEATTALEVAGTGAVTRVLTRYEDLLRAMTEVVVGARRRLVVTGSRSREPSYLRAIEDTLEHFPDLVHYRELYGPPRHRALHEHLDRVFQLRDPSERRHGIRTLHVGVVDSPSVLERHFVASESAAVVPLPSFHGFDGFDCGVMLGAEAAAGLVQHGREACAAARALVSAAEVRRLPVGSGPDLGEREAL